MDNVSAFVWGFKINQLIDHQIAPFAYMAVMWWDNVSAKLGFIKFSG